MMRTNWRSPSVRFGSKRAGAALSAAAAFVCLTGCSSLGHKLKSWVTGDDAQKERTVGPRFSEQENVKANSDRKYQRMNRKKFEEDASLGQDAGSLWVMEGQGGYLFAQNQMRMVGDPLNVKIDGAPKAQLQTKAKVIAKLLERLDRPELRGPASAGAGAAPAPGGAAGANGQAGAAAGGAAGGNGQQQAGPPGAPAPGGPPVGAPEKPEPSLAPQLVPTRIVEVLKDGSYRVKGSQPFMIGKREYKAIVTGVVRAEDFDETGVDAAKLLDSQFDVVGSRKGMGL